MSVITVHGCRAAAGQIPLQIPAALVLQGLRKTQVPKGASLAHLEHLWELSKISTYPQKIIWLTVSCWVMASACLECREHGTHGVFLVLGEPVGSSLGPCLYFILVSH